MNSRAMTLARLDSQRLRDLISAGESISVERKRARPDEGLGPTFASFANTIGGWVLLGVDNKGDMVGWTPPGREEPIDYLRKTLAAELDPLPPFTAGQFEVDGTPICVVQIPRSADLPHVVQSTGAIYVRGPGGKEPVSDYRSLRELVRLGDDAREAAASRLWGLQIGREAIDPSTLNFRDATHPESPEDILQVVVAGCAISVPESFPAWAMTRRTAEHARRWAATIIAGERPLADTERGGRVGGQVEPRARGLVARGFGSASDIAGPRQWLSTVAVDAAGVVTLSTARRRVRGPLDMEAFERQELAPLLKAAAEALLELGAIGRVLVELQLRGTGELQVESRGGVGTLAGNRQHCAGELLIPSTDAETRELACAWGRQLNRDAGIPDWELDGERPA